MSKNDNPISEKAAQSDPTLRFSGPVEAVAVGGSPEIRDRVLAYLNYAGNVGIGAATGAGASMAVLGTLDPTAVGFGVIAGALNGKIGWKI